MNDPEHVSEPPGCSPLTCVAELQAVVDAVDGEGVGRDAELPAAVVIAAVGGDDGVQQDLPARSLSS